MLRLVRCRHMYGRNISSVCCPFVVVVCVVHATKKIEKNHINPEWCPLTFIFLYENEKWNKRSLRIHHNSIRTHDCPNWTGIERQWRGGGGGSPGGSRLPHQTWGFSSLINSAAACIYCFFKHENKCPWTCYKLDLWSYKRKKKKKKKEKETLKVVKAKKYQLKRNKWLKYPYSTELQQV